MARHRSRDEWARLVAQWRQSGQSRVVFCKRHGLAVSTLSDWARRLRTEAAEGAAEAQARFVPVRVVQPAATVAQPTRAVTVHVAGTRVDIDGSSSPQWAAQVTRELLGC